MSILENIFRAPIAKRFKEDLEENLNSSSDLNHKLVDNCIAFVGASGGVGCSTIVSNLAVEFAKKMRVIVVDVSIEYPSQPYQFACSMLEQERDYIDLLTGRAKLADCIDKSSTTGVHLLYAKHRTVQSSVFAEEDACATTLTDVIENLRQLYDVVLIDSPNRLDSLIVNTALYRADKVYLVWDDGIQSILNTDKFKSGLKNVGITYGEKITVILNKRTNFNYSSSILKELGVELIAILPYAHRILEESLNQRIFIAKGAAGDANSKRFCVALSNLAQKILLVGGYNE